MMLLKLGIVVVVVGIVVEVVAGVFVVVVDIVENVMIGVVIDVVIGVGFVEGDSVQLALPVLQEGQGVNFPIRCDSR